MTDLEVIHSDAALSVVIARNVQVNTWTDAPTVEHLRMLSRTSTALSRKNPRGAALINLMVRGTPSFTQEVRDETVKALKQNYFRLGTAHIILLGGFSGTAVRAFMSTATLIARPQDPHKVFSEPEAAAAWLAPLLLQGAEAWSPVALVTLVKQSLARV